MSNEVRNKNRKKQDFLIDVFDDINNNPKRFWKYTKVKGQQCSVPDEIFLHGTVARDELSKANLFNDYFLRTFNQDTYELPNINGFINDNLRNLILTQNDVLKVLLNLKVNKAQEIDGIWAIFFNCSLTLVSSLTKLFNLNIERECLPLEWKSANVIPIF